MEYNHYYISPHFINNYDVHHLLIIPTTVYSLSLSLIIFWSTELRKTNPLKQVEFVEKLDFCKEFSCPIYPDTTVLEDITFRGLLFSIY